MSNCNCKEPCEDCKEEKVDLDNISSLLFNEVSKEAVQDDKETKPKTQKPKKESKTKKFKPKKQVPRKIECENMDYKDPVTEEYKITWNNKMGCTVWDTETRTFNF